MMPKWTDDEEFYESRILVIDRDDWLSTGVVLTGCDPGLYFCDTQQVPRDGPWYIADDLPVVENFLHSTDLPTAKRLACEQECWWHRAGSIEMEDVLARRNEGPASPVIDLDLDSPLHVGNPHEALHLRPVPRFDPELDSGSEDDEFTIITDGFDLSELVSDARAPGLCSEVYNDTLDQPVTSVWDGRLSKTRPKFAFSLYVKYRFLTADMHPKMLSTVLNKRLLAKSQWTLDAVANTPNLESAFDYHASSTLRRSSAQLVRLKNCIRLVLNKATDGKLPEELLVQIEDYPVSPRIPDYSSRPMRVHQDLFLYATTISCPSVS